MAYDKEIFIKEARLRHSDFYSYDKFEYVNAKTPGIITCPKHGDFLQTPFLHAHLGRGCPKCKSSRLEKALIHSFGIHSIEYEFQVKCDGFGNQSFDFYIPSKRLFIECQGEQHYVPTNFGKKSDEKFLEEKLKERQELDKEKYLYCKENGFDIIYFANPMFFKNKEVDIHSGFYADKYVFEQPRQVVGYINGLVDFEEEDTPFHRFSKDIRSLSPFIMAYNNKLSYKKYIIFFNKLEGDNKALINDVKRHNEKNGYKVIHVFEDEYLNHREIVVEKIRHLLNLSTDAVKIGARKCVIMECSKDEAYDFLTINHIQGFSNSTVYLGAYYNGEIVGVMTFLRECEHCWNLNRFASSNNKRIQGLGGKMFKYFVRNYSPTHVKSFADRRWTVKEDDNLYTKIGFVFDGKVGPEYRYFKDGETKERMHKFGFRKKILSKKYNLPLTMTEKEMTEKLGYTRIWDCGLYRYVWSVDGAHDCTDVKENEDEQEGFSSVDKIISKNL